MCIVKDKTTLVERKERSKAKDKNFSAMVKSIAYKDEGELYLNNLHRNCLAKIIRTDNFTIEHD